MNNLESNLEECNEIIERIEYNDQNIQNFKKKFEEYCKKNNKKCSDKLINEVGFIMIVCNFYLKFKELNSSNNDDIAYSTICKLLDDIKDINDEDGYKKITETFKKLYCKFVLFDKEIDRLHKEILNYDNSFVFTDDLKKLILSYALKIINSTEISKEDKKNRINQFSYGRRSRRSRNRRSKRSKRSKRRTRRHRRSYKKNVM